MEWNKLLGLSASLLAGGAAWFPKTAPWSWGNRASLENQKYGILGSVLPQLDGVQIQFVQCRSLTLTDIKHYTRYSYRMLKTRG